MGEESSNQNQTEPQLPSVPETEQSPVQENQSETPDPPNAVVNPDPNEKTTSSVDQQVADHADKTDTGDSVDKDAMLARVVAEKRLALIKAWEESEKTKAENRAYKKNSAVGLWEDSRKASVEAQLKKIEESMERKKAEYVEKMRNKIAEIHRSAEEKRAFVEAQKREEFLDLEETAAKYRNRGNMPRKFFPCFSG
ncbi:remorin-like [Abrus precatorius]|uniref:Remorin-like n=1 Tax=Abrus precatorius TaxID=3816 RepID=A0A8B8LWF3_ABRPR|nr:remorin-like [Abrus precatorius]